MSDVPDVVTAESPSIFEPFFGTLNSTPEDAASTPGEAPAEADPKPGQAGPALPTEQVNKPESAAPPPYTGRSLLNPLRYVIGSGETSAPAQAAAGGTKQAIPTPEVAVSTTQAAPTVADPKPGEAGPALPTEQANKPESAAPPPYTGRSLLNPLRYVLGSGETSAPAQAAAGCTTQVNPTTAAVTPNPTLEVVATTQAAPATVNSTPGEAPAEADPKPGEAGPALPTEQANKSESAAPPPYTGRSLLNPLRYVLGSGVTPAPAQVAAGGTTQVNPTTAAVAPNPTPEVAASNIQAAPAVFASSADPNTAPVTPTVASVSDDSSAMDIIVAGPVTGSSDPAPAAEDKGTDPMVTD